MLQIPQNQEVLEKRRAEFSKLITLFETLGFHCRERFYAGEEAGWGAQVMENLEAGLVLFLDVDLSPDEIACDFAHEPLPKHDKLGTIGLWCALHGDSIHEAGMHHLEGQFEFADLCNDLAGLGSVMENLERREGYKGFNQKNVSDIIRRTDPRT